jgi:predicted ATPase with chaperone activity
MPSPSGEPLESGQVVVARLGLTTRFAARFTLVAGMPFVLV